MEEQRVKGEHDSDYSQETRGVEGRCSLVYLIVSYVAKDQPRYGWLRWICRCSSPPLEVLISSVNSIRERHTGSLDFPTEELFNLVAFSAFLGPLSVVVQSLLIRGVVCQLTADLQVSYPNRAKEEEEALH